MESDEKSWLPQVCTAPQPGFDEPMKLDVLLGCAEALVRNVTQPCGAATSMHATLCGEVPKTERRFWFLL